ETPNVWNPARFLLCGDASFIAFLPCILAASIRASLLPVLGSGNHHPGGRAVLRLILLVCILQPAGTGAMLVVLDRAGGCANCCAFGGACDPAAVWAG